MNLVVHPAGAAARLEKIVTAAGPLPVVNADTGPAAREARRRAASFGMRVLAVDPVEQVRPAEVAALWLPNELNKLLAASDFVVIAAPHTPETEQLIRRAQLQAMKPGGYLINIGRGAIVNLA